MTVAGSPQAIDDLNQARKEIESLFVVYPGIGEYSKAPTGEPYIGIMSGGYKKENEHSPCVAWTEKHAIRLWKEAVIQYAAGKSGVLYWRAEPELDGIEMFWEGWNAQTDKIEKYGCSHMMWRVYSRLLISDQPVSSGQ